MLAADIVPATTAAGAAAACVSTLSVGVFRCLRLRRREPPCVDIVLEAPVVTSARCRRKALIIRDLYLLRRYCRCEVGCVRSRDGDDGGVEVPTGSKTNDKIFARFLLEQLRELCTYTHTRVLRSTSISSMIKHLKRHTVLVHGPGSERYE